MKKDNEAEQEPAETPDPAKAFEASKKAFEEAVSKTKSEAGEKPEDEKVVVEPVPHKKPKAAKQKPAPKEEPKAPEVDFAAKLADMERRLEEATRKPVAPPVDPLKAIQDRLSEKFGEEEGATLAETFGDLVKPLLEKTALMEKMLVDATERGRKQTAAANHKRLSKEYAQLKGNDAALGMIDMQVEALIGKNPNKFSSLDEVYDHVVSALYGDASDEEEADEGEDDAEAIAASAVTVPDKKTKERKLTPLEKSRMVFDQLMKDPDNVSAATRLARELKIG